MAGTTAVETKAALPESVPASGRVSDPRRAPWPVLLVFLAPALVIYLGLTAYPAFRTIFDSLFTIEGMERSYVGLANYRDLIGDEADFDPMRNDPRFTAIVKKTGLLDN